MPLTRRVALALAAVLLAAAPAAVVCPSANVCSFGDLPVGCCGATSCTIDGTLTVSGATCTIDFGARNVTVETAGKIVVGSNILTMTAGSFRVRGQITALGAAGGPAGGKVTVQTTGGAATAFSAEKPAGSPSPLIDVSGGGISGAGSLWIFADGPVAFTSATLRADGLGSGLAGSAAGSIRVLVDGPGNVTIGGSTLLSAAGAEEGGGVDIEARQGTVTLETGTRIGASASNGLAGEGGSVAILAASIQALGTIDATGGASDDPEDDGGNGGFVSLEALTGVIQLVHNGGGITVDGGTRGSGGTVVLTTHTVTTGTITIDAPISAQAQGSADEFGGPSGGEVSARAGGHVLVKKRIDARGKGDASALIELAAVRDVDLTGGSIVGKNEGDGGSLTLTAGHDVIVGGEVEMQAQPGSDGDGGEVAIEAGNEVKVSKTLDASGAGDADGGLVSLTGGRSVNVAPGGSVVAVGGNQGFGGDVEIVAGESDSEIYLPGDVVIDGKIDAQTPNLTFGGGSITIEGCNVTIRHQVDSRGGFSSTNDVTARRSLTITSAGSVRTATTGDNTFTVCTPPSATCLAPVVSGTVSPAASTTSLAHCSLGNTDNCLFPCPTCGNSTTEFPEECDAGNADPCVSGCRNCRDEDCDDANPCHHDACDPSGGCFNFPVPDDTSCDDGPLDCMGDAYCSAGICVPGTLPPPECMCTPGTPLCDDASVCTIDSCEDGVGCQHTAIPGCCESDTDCPDACDVCNVSENHCETVPNCCSEDADCDDGDPCNGVETCNTGTTPGTCNDPADEPDGPHADCGDACHPDAACASGQCALGDPLDCADETHDDGDPCTADFCDASDGCRHDVMEDCCNGTPGECPSDGNPCTTESCDLESNHCVSDLAFEGCEVCARDTDCDVFGQCAGAACDEQGVCVTVTPPDCDDGHPDTVDRCVAPDDGPPACEHDCSCSDGNVNTADNCVVDPVTGPGCRFDCLNDAACSNGNPCDGLETCVGGACVAGTPGVCDDQDPCTDDSQDANQCCANVAKTGLASVTCLLEGLDRTIAEAGLDAKVGRKIAKKMKAINRQLAKVSAAEAKGDTKKQGKALKSAAKKLAKLAKFVGKQKKIARDVAQSLAADIRAAAAAANSLRTTLKR